MSVPGEPSTPGIGGYLLAWLVSVLVFTAVLEVGLDDPVDNGFTDFVVLAWGVGIYSLPFALVGIPVVHFLGRSVRAQSVHVLAAGAVGWACLGLLPLLAGEPEAAVLGLALAGPTALGRLAVVPLVWDRRRNSAAPALTG